MQRSASVSSSGSSHDSENERYYDETYYQEQGVATTTVPITTTTTTGTTGALVGGLGVASTEALAGDVANIHLGPNEPLKGRGSKLRNKLHRSKKHRHGAATTGVAGATGVLAAEQLADRSKFNGYGPVDQLDHKLADRNLIDNGIAPTRGETYNVGGFPAVESFRQDPDGIMRHKFTGQTHFDHEGPATGPGFTNGDLYDKPGFAGTKDGQPRHNGPITALAHKIVGQKYTTHEPLMDKIYVEPHQKGPIDALAHMIVGHGAGHPTETGKLTHKEKAEGPIDALVHKLTGSLHDPLHHKGGLGAHQGGIQGGVNAIPVTDNIAHPVVTEGTGITTAKPHGGIIGKIVNKLTHHHDSTVGDKAF